MSELDRLIAEQARDARSFRVFGVSVDAAYLEKRPERLLVTDPCHGTVDGYSNHKCRCQKCRLAWRLYQREWKRRWRQRMRRQGLSTRGRPLSEGRP